VSTLRTWILAGQSNMEGYGLLSEIRHTAPDERVQSFSSAGRWETAVDPLHRLAESFTPVHLDLMREGNPALEGVSDEEIARLTAEARVYGAGLGIPFARAVRDATGAPVGLIPAAHGGTSLEQWSPARREEGGRSLYGAMLERARRAADQRDIELAGILWYQGESDASDVATATTYADRFDAWVAAARSDLGLPDLPVIVVQLGRFIGADGFAGWDAVCEAQRTLSERTSATACVAAADLPLADPIHISAAGFDRLGGRVARIALGGDELRLSDVRRASDAINGFPTVRVRATGVRGGWRDAGPIPGFQVVDAAGRPHDAAAVFDAAPAPDDPSTIVLRLTALPEGARISYGLGLDAVVTLVDAEDMPLPVFAPQPIGTAE
jgi:sialate O-acetylesterase